jgi:hypothetical protein
MSHPFEVIVGFKYRHYKGGLYLPVAVAETHNHNGDLDVVYLSLTHGKYVTRPLRRDSRKEDSWLDSVEWPDGCWRMRFCPEEPALARLFEITVP